MKKIVLWKGLLQNRAFSLFELLVVLVIVGMISSVVVPKMTNGLQNLRLKTAAKKVTSALRYARNQATHRNEIYLAIFDVETNRLTITSITANNNIDDNLNDNITTERKKQKQVYELPDEVEFLFQENVCEEIQTHQYMVIFFPNGSSGGCSTVILKNNRDIEYKILVNFVTGDIRLIV